MSSLADAILFGTAEEVKRYLEAGADPNAIDDYGFPPLIEAAIANRVDIAKILVDFKADLNQSDLAGRTALHWACENNNLSFCELLLKAGSDPNAPASSAQSALVIPILRSQTALKTLLYRYGANLNFARDFINMKLAGHRFELTGHTYIANPKNAFLLIDLEGFYLEFVLNIIKSSLMRYQRHYSARQFHDLAPQIKKILDSLDRAAELIRYQQYTLDLKKLMPRIDSLLNNPLLIIPAAFTGHAISFVIFEKRFFAKIDRGANSQFEGSIVIYEIGKPEKLTQNLLKAILYEKQNDTFMQEGINQILGLKRLKNLPIGGQITGNCSWANTEASIPTLLFFLLSSESQIQLSDNHAMRIALDFYEAWHEWDKDRALENCIKEIQYKSPHRDASYAILLAKILFQTCQYEDPKNVERAEKIMPFLYEEKFAPFLENYIKIYYQKKWSGAGENLMHLFDMISPPSRRKR